MDVVEYSKNGIHEWLIMLPRAPLIFTVGSIACTPCQGALSRLLTFQRLEMTAQWCTAEGSYMQQWLESQFTPYWPLDRLVVVVVVCALCDIDQAVLALLTAHVLPCALHCSL